MKTDDFASLPRLHDSNHMNRTDQYDDIQKTKQKAVYTRKMIDELENRMDDIKKQIYHMDNSLNTTADFKKLIKLKKDRRKFESDAQLLANRIELLKKEELKIWKKIEEYHRKANEIYDLKSKNKERQEEKDLNEYKITKTRDMKRSDGATIRRKRNDAKLLRNEIMQHEKHKVFAKIKSEQRLNEGKLMRIQKKMNDQRKQMTAEIKYNQSIGRLRLHKYEEDKQKKIYSRIKKNAKDEKEVIGKIKKELNSMCKMEGDWITKLKSSQVIQTQAFEKLKNVLILTTDDLANQYENQEQEYAEGDELEEIEQEAYEQKHLDGRNEHSEDDINGQAPNMDQDISQDD